MKNAYIVGADLSNADLSYLDLENQNLSNCNLDGTNLNKSNLKNANLDFSTSNMSTTALDATITGATWKLNGQNRARLFSEKLSKGPFGKSLVESLEKKGFPNITVNREKPAEPSGFIDKILDKYHQREGFMHINLRS